MSTDSERFPWAPLWSVDEAASHLNLLPTDIKAACKTGLLDYYKPGEEYLFGNDVMTDPAKAGELREIVSAFVRDRTARREREHIARSIAENRQWSIYFIRAVGTAFVKIGISEGGLKRRLIALQIASPFELRLAAVIWTSRPSLEREIHAQFAHLRTRGEWFRLDGSLVSYIRQRAEQQIDEALAVNSPDQ